MVNNETEAKSKVVRWLPDDDEDVMPPKGKNRLSAAELKLLDTVTALRREQGLRDYYLTRSEEERSRLEALLDLIKLGVLFVDRDGRAQHANRMLKVIWGFPLDENLSGMRDTLLIDRTGKLLATETIYLLARHLFDELGYRRFEWKCNDENLPSKRAAHRFGFTPEGVLPLTILFDATGKEVLRVTGGYDWSAPEAVALVRGALAAKPG